MSKTFHARSAVLALVTTLAMLSGVYSVAAYEHRTAVTAASRSTVLVQAPTLTATGVPGQRG